MSDYRTVRRKPLFINRDVTVGDYTVRFFASGTCQMGDGRTEPQMWADIRHDGQLIVANVALNSASMGQPGYSVRGVEATAAEILHAVLGDEHIFTGEPSFPDHHDHVTAKDKH